MKTPKHIVATAMTAAALAMLHPTPVSAGTACAFQPGSGTVTVSLGDEDRWSIVVGNGSRIVLRNATNTIECGGATATNTAEVQVRGPVGPGTWFGVRNDGAGGRFPADIAFNVDLGTDPEAGYGDEDTLAIWGTSAGDRYSSDYDMWSATFDPEARTGMWDMDGTLMNLTGLLLIDVRLDAGNDEYAGPARYLNAGAGADDIQILSFYENDVRGGPGNDLIRSDPEGFFNILHARGGPGDDTMSHARTIWGGQGDDWINGGSDAKIVEGNGANGADTIIGRSDATVVYSGRTADIVVRLDGKANDGEAGEHDNVMIGLTYLEMGSGDDLFVGSAGDEVVWAFPGDDTMLGKGGADDLRGLSGHDTADGGPGRDYCTAEVRLSCEYSW